MSISPSSDNSSFNDSISKFFRKLLAMVADLRLAIVLLLAIALFSISGTVIEQNQGLSYYQENYPENPALWGFFTWKLLLNLGFDHVYTTWWYVSILVLFGTSLIACTFRRQLPALKAAQIWKYYRQPREFNKLALSAELSVNGLAEIKESLTKKGYKIHQDNDSLYAQKGIIGRVGPIIVHIGMIVILLGAIWGAFTGFFAQEMIAEGETFTIKNFIEAGALTNLKKPQDFSVKVKDFRIDYSPQGAVDQFYSDLSIIDQEGKELDKKTIFVNQPLRYKGVTFYQTSWSISGVKVQLNNSPIFQLPMAELDTKGKGRIWGTWIPTNPDMSNGVSLITKDLQGTMFIYDMSGQLVGATRPGMPVEVNGVNLKVLDLIGSTGLQIKADPGVPIVYLGFALLMVGVVMSYVSFSQVWVLEKDDSTFIGGKTNRAQVTFEREIFTMIDSL
ncbi:cytochrome c biogenesis protein [Cyanobacterium stanieri LEGE 03274]|uniref:Cytochrome c biogenesis protein CcsB n=1 Tax=Cyanobacterium stanieri LEGE 03274 TaxID=1828756 RepID=A0ABR9UZR6_9CHRO|nr:cytochrome c biogenesis protein [Cyanobacterium stanieri]MBE9221133.1 cytochrome c biogenesis protein [Cyanobacterium stanieri LEGE 03274]